MDRTPTTSFYSRTRSSAAGRLIRSFSSADAVSNRSFEMAGGAANTPARPGARLMNKSRPNFYGPGVRLEDGERVEEFHFSESDEENLDDLCNGGVDRQSQEHPETSNINASPFQSPRVSVQPRHEGSYNCSQGSMCSSNGKSNGNLIEQSGDVLLMLQQQQILLQQVITSQKKLEESQSSFEVKLTDLEEKMNERPLAMSPASNDDGRRK